MGRILRVQKGESLEVVLFFIDTNTPSCWGCGEVKTGTDRRRLTV